MFFIMWCIVLCKCVCDVCRGLVVKSILQAQGSSQTFTHVFAALVSIINTKVSNALSLDSYLQTCHELVA